MTNLPSRWYLDMVLGFASIMFAILGFQELRTHDTKLGLIYGSAAVIAFVLIKIKWVGVIGFAGMFMVRGIRYFFWYGEVSSLLIALLAGVIFFGIICWKRRPVSP